ncbi:MAG: thymidine kinase [Planctomycetota bacterium]|nr:thymidine kinase [Planctomycetota bacterium]
MAKLYFRHGTVGSAKTLNLLAVAHNYERQGKKIVVIKPGFDDRYGEQEVASRAGLQREAHIVLAPSSRLDVSDFSDVQCVLVDEVQFLTVSHIEQLRDIVDGVGVPVICYGLRTDFRSRLFDGSRRLMELADSIEEVKTTCHRCNRKAIFNLKCIDGVAMLDGPSKQVGGDETFQQVCSFHFVEALERDGIEGIEDQMTESEMSS